MTPTQCKMARMGLSWLADDLAKASGLTRVTIARFESGHPMAPASIKKMREALEAAGAGFTQKPGRIGVTVPL
ncbi:transcriptional regulator with XRE-family HTH domain [Sphingopyxis sp. OAS728]|nr:transcriptional regulator with XRE-family HTH domain [Sphingopyxis sp. OAS728]